MRCIKLQSVRWLVLLEVRSDACAAISYSSVMQPTGEEEAHAAHVLCCWWYWQTVCRQTLDTVHLEVGGLVVQIDYDDFVEWMPEVVAGLSWLRNPTTRLRRKSAWLWRQTEKPSDTLRRPCHVRAEFSTHRVCALENETV